MQERYKSLLPLVVRANKTYCDISKIYGHTQSLQKLYRTRNTHIFLNSKSCTTPATEINALKIFESRKQFEFRNFILPNLWFKYCLKMKFSPFKTSSVPGFPFQKRAPSRVGVGAYWWSGEVNCRICFDK